MKRWFTSIGLLLAASVLMLAQHGGGGHGSGGGARTGGGAFHGSGLGLPPIAPSRPTPSIGLSPPSIGLSPPSIGLSPQSFGAPARPVSPFYSRSPYNYSRGGRRDRRVSPYAFIGAPFFPFDYGSYPNDSGYDAAGGEPPPEPTDLSPADSQLSAQVAQLSAQINDLQNQLGQSGGQPSGAPSATPQAEESTPPSPPITLVLNSGKTLKVQSYAVVGHTFWDLSSQPARKIPVSQINISASAQATEAAGAEFPKIGG